jgi:alkanesulfonate monooxygenase SsuD/methylene tetrahydromethanopterin reductase-like flavin-dependent oxidoreductase (luciferase family)
VTGTRFGVYIGPIYPGEMDAADAFELARATARTAHESGFDGIFAAHHYSTGPSHTMFHPLLLLARLSSECPEGYLGTAVYLLSYTHPVIAAEATAFLDVMCGGRLLFGVGRGYRAVELESLRIPRGERGERLVEAIQAVRTLWANDPASFDGRFYRFTNVSIRPRPIQQPGPPVWVGADTLASVARVPEVGDAWIASGRHTRTFIRQALPGYRRSLEYHGRPFNGVPMFRELHVAADSRCAEEEMRASLRAMYQSYARWGQPGERYDLEFDELKQERILVGSPAEVAEKVIEYRDEFGVPFMWFRLYYPGMDPELALETIRLFGAEVIPLCRQPKQALGGVAAT